MPRNSWRISGRFRLLRALAGRAGLREFLAWRCQLANGRSNRHTSAIFSLLVTLLGQAGKLTQPRRVRQIRPTTQGRARYGACFTRVPREQQGLHAHERCFGAE